MKSYNLNMSRRGLAVMTLCVCQAVALTASTAYAFDIGLASDFTVLYEGNGGNTLNYNNSVLSGDIGIGLTGKAAVSSGTVNGSFDFSAANTGQFSISGGTVTGGENYNVANVTSGLNTVNALAQTLGGEAGTSTTVTSGGSINASAGMLDGGGNRVFTVTSVSFPNGTFTINGSASDYVVLNVGSAASFNGAITLTGGITSSHVLINMTGGNYTTLSGGNTLTISTSGLTTTGIFLDPNGDFQINHSILDGQIFGGDTHNVSIVSGADIVGPTPAVPDGGTTALLLAMGVAGIGFARRGLQKKA
jgi:hypothetical protein